MHRSAEHPVGAFSIITISKDDAPGLARTLASIARQSVMPEAVVLVRSGTSRDLSVDAALTARSVEVADPGQGISAAFNAAIAASQGDWLVFLNGGDAFSRPDSLAMLAEACGAVPAPDIVACRARTDAGVMIPYIVPRRLPDYLFISHQASAFRRTLFDEIGPYSPRFRVRMDLDWMARYLQEKGAARICFVDRSIVDYTLDGISSTNLVDFYTEEFRVLRRSTRFLSALLGLLVRRLPERLLREALRAVARSR
jgi:CTP:molybdopterin cytidylyltransferase MocA